MGESKTLILIDGHALAFRQYYALERTNMKTKDGTPTWAVYGFFKAIFDLLEKIKPDFITFSGGVAKAIYEKEQDPFIYGDIGVLLAEEIFINSGFKDKTSFIYIGTIDIFFFIFE